MLVCTNMRGVAALGEGAIGVRRAICIELVLAVGFIALLANRAVEAGIDLSANPHTVSDLDGGDFRPDANSLADYF